MTTPYFEHAGITLYHGDCRDILPELPQADIVLTDPPYSETTHSGARTNLSTAKGTVDPGMLINFDSITYGELHAILSMAAKASKKWVVSFMDWRHIAKMEESPPEGLRFVRYGIWVKPNSAPQFTGDRPGTGWEGIAFMHALGRLKWNGKGRSSVFTCNIVHQNHKLGTNPTEKPLPLLKELITLFSDEGDTVLDPFSGSCAVLRAAQLTGRNAIGIERDERQCEIAARMLSARQGLLFDLPNGKLT